MALNTAPVADTADVAVLDIAHDACGEAALSRWEPATRNEYLDNVAAYYQSAWDQRLMRSGIVAYELFDDGGMPINFVLPSGERFRAYRIETVALKAGALTKSCELHMHPHEAPSFQEMQEWSSSEPEEMLVGIGLDQTSWQLRPPEGSVWEYVIVNSFDATKKPSPNARPHPFRGLIIRFTKTEF